MVAMLGKGLLLFDFELPSEAERVLARGKRSIKENFIIFDRWNLEVGCLCKDSIANEAWVRVVGLLLHLWSLEVFKRIGDGCGGFVAVDEDTGSLSELQWARIPVKCAERSYLILLILLWGRVAILFSYGGSLYLGSRRWCRLEACVGRVV